MSCYLQIETGKEMCHEMGFRGRELCPATLIEALHALYSNLLLLKTIEGPEFLWSSNAERYRSLLVDAYAVYSRVETIVDVLVHELAFQYTRLNDAVEQ